jgi:hypothetical protein
MKKLNKEDFKRNKVYHELFYPNSPLGLDGKEMSSEDFFDQIKSYKIPESEKSKIIKKIIQDYDFMDKIIYDRIRKCLPNGFNSMYSIEDNEYESLKKEFNL